MKFLISWQIHEGKIEETLTMFSGMTAEQEQSMMGDHIRMTGRWHDLVRGTGVAIVESDDAAAVSAYAMKWSGQMDLDIVPVIDDDEARAVGQNQSA